MTPRAPIPRPNWITAPVSQLPCPHIIGGTRCGNNVLGRIKFPPGWIVYAISLEREDQASGQGPVKQCGDCHRFVEVVIRTR